MRFYLDQETARWFRQVFMKPARQLAFPKTFVPRLNEVWNSEGSYLDLGPVADNKRFLGWLIRNLRNRAPDNDSGGAFEELSEKLEDYLNRSAVERLGDIVDPERRATRQETQRTESPREMAVRARFARRKILP